MKKKDNQYEPVLALWFELEKKAKKQQIWRDIFILKEKAPLILLIFLISHKIHKIKILYDK